MTRERARDHVEASAELLWSANGPADFEKLAGGPEPLNSSLGEYKSQVQLASRAFRFAAMAAFDGRMEEARSIVEELGWLAWPLVARHIDLDACLKGAVRRVGTTNDLAAVRAVLEQAVPSEDPKSHARLRSI